MRRKWIVVAALLFGIALAIVAYRNASHSDNLLYSAADWDPVLVEDLNRGPHYLPADLLIRIPPAPFSGSPTTKTEVAYMLDIQAKRTSADVAIIEKEAKNPMPFFLSEFGLDPYKMPRTMELINATAAETGWFLLREKKHYSRARPHQVDPRITPAIPVPHHPAYPSAHAGQTHAVASALSRLIPARAEAWMQFADAVAYHRELAGVHYPTDSAAGKQLGGEVVAALFKNDQYLALVREAEKEWSDKQ